MKNIKDRFQTYERYETVEVFHWEHPYPDDLPEVELHDIYGYITINGIAKMLCPGDRLIKVDGKYREVCKKQDFDKMYTAVK